VLMKVAASWDIIISVAWGCVDGYLMALAILFSLFTLFYFIFIVTLGGGCSGSFLHALLSFPLMLCNDRIWQWQ
jgi:hypothetical protein